MPNNKIKLLAMPFLLNSLNQQIHPGDMVCFLKSKTRHWRGFEIAVVASIIEERSFSVRSPKIYDSPNSEILHAKISNRIVEPYDVVLVDPNIYKIINIVDSSLYGLDEEEKKMNARPLQNKVYELLLGNPLIKFPKKYILEN